MFKRIILPGSGQDDSAGAAVGVVGRFSEDELGALSEVARWWRNRSALSDSADPLESHFGGVDVVGHAQTVGDTTSTVNLVRPLLPTDGAALLALALGLSADRTTSYAVAALCNFHRTPGGGWYSRYSHLGRSPDTNSAEVRAAVELGSGRPVLQLRGVGGVTVDWKVEVLRLEWT